MSSMSGGNTSLEGFARAGLVAKAALYATVAILALMLAAGFGGTATDKQGAIAVLASKDFGTYILTFLGIGLAGYALWRLAMAALDTDNAGTDAEGVVKRVGYAVSGVSYGALAVLALSIALDSGGASGSGNSGGTQAQTAGILGWPAGQWIVGAVGLIVIGFAGYCAYKGIVASFMDDLNTGRMSAREKDLAVWLGRGGHVARAVVLGIAGVFLLTAAVQHDPGDARGLDGALKELIQAPAGPWLLGAVALGLLAFAAYCALEARYRSV